MGRMKWSRANVVDPSPGVFFHQPPKGRIGGLCHRRQHARGPSENFAPLRGGSVQCAQKTAIHTRETIQGWGSRHVASILICGRIFICVYKTNKDSLLLLLLLLATTSKARKGMAKGL